MPTPEPVRPTLAALAALSLPVPPVEIPLTSIQHPLIQRAQQIPSEVNAGGATRINSLTDRVWLKVKTGRHRGIVTRLGGDEARAIGAELAAYAVGSYWLGAAGLRRDGSPEDFYASVLATYGKDSRPLLPTTRDAHRWKLEVAAAFELQAKSLVITAVARSLLDGRAHHAFLPHFSIGAVVRADEGEQMIAFIADQVYNPQHIAFFMHCVPGIPPESWQPEPGGLMDLAPESGQIIWSALLPTEVAQEILRLYDEFTGDSNAPSTPE